MRTLLALKTIINLALLTLCFGCNDMWLDKEIQIDDSLYVIYANGDGFRLGKKIDASVFNTDILKSTLTALYKTGDVLIAKTAPENSGKGTEYYKINYKNLPDSSAVQQITLKEYDSLRSGLAELLNSR